MSSYNITLKAPLKGGTFYWVTNVKADSEEEAVVAAEHLFMAEAANAADWEFSDYDAEEV